MSGLALWKAQSDIFQIQICNIAFPSQLPLIIIEVKYVTIDIQRSCEGIIPNQKINKMGFFSRFVKRRIKGDNNSAVW